MATLEARIDELYQRSLGDFTAARNALAKTLDRAAAAPVRRLEKPSAAAWAVNQVYWRSRDVWNRLLASGERLRRAQVAVIEGRTAHLREAADAHRDALAAAVREGDTLARAAGVRAAPEALMRTFEALSLAALPPAAPGRLTRPLQPAGFEALAGIAAAPPARSASAAPVGVPPGVKNRSVAPSDTHVHQAAARAAARRARQQQARVGAAERAVARAETAEAEARGRWEAAQRALEHARQALVSARRPRD